MLCVCVCVCVCVYAVEYYSVIKEWKNAICSYMDGSRSPTKWRSQRERQIPYVITYMWNLKYDTNELIYKTDSQTEG